MQNIEFELEFFVKFKTLNFYIELSWIFLFRSFYLVHFHSSCKLSEQTDKMPRNESKHKIKPVYFLQFFLIYLIFAQFRLTRIRKTKYNILTFFKCWTNLTLQRKITKIYQTDFLFALISRHFIGLVWYFSGRKEFYQKNSITISWKQFFGKILNFNLNFSQNSMYQIF